VNVDAAYTPAPTPSLVAPGNSEGQILTWNTGPGLWMPTAFALTSLNLTSTSTDYTLDQDDAGTAVVLTGSTNRTFTVSAFGPGSYFATGTIIYLVTAGTGHITVQGASGVTLNGTTSLNSQGKIAILLNIAEDEWVIHH